jgi:hypothetical protein
MSATSLHHETDSSPGLVEVLLAVLLTLLLMLGLARPAGGGHSLPVPTSSSTS